MHHRLTDERISHSGHKLVRRFKCREAAPDNIEGKTIVPMRNEMGICITGPGFCSVSKHLGRIILGSRDIPCYKAMRDIAYGSFLQRLICEPFRLYIR